MSAASSIESDTAAVLQLAGHDEPKPSEIGKRRQRLLAALAAGTDADVWMWTLQQFEQRSLDTVYIGLIDKGWSNGTQRAGWLDGTFSAEFQELIAPVRHQLREVAVFTRADLIDDAAWYASAFFNRYRAPYGLDDFLLAYHPAGPNLLSAVRLHRFQDRPAFGERERMLTEEVVRSCEWLHHPTVPNGQLPSLANLAPRQRKVLLLLLQGGSAKQIAQDLALSVHTVNEYMQDLHEHFGVRSRAEIMALFISPEILRASTD